jgi:hypothetical protein
MGKDLIGDVYGIDTKEGLALVQIARFGKDKTSLGLVRVLDGFASNTSASTIESIVQKKELFFLQWPMGFARIRRLKKMIHPLGNYALPQGIVLPTTFRTENRRKDGTTEWLTVTEEYVWGKGDIQNDAYLQLSPWEVWSVPDLVEQLENHWRLNDWH